jgi:acetyl-CoA C-acetyltransferase
MAPMPGSGNQEMLTAVLRGMVDRFGLRASGSARLRRGGDEALHPVGPGARMRARLRARPDTPGLDLQRACGTGLEARSWSRTRSPSARSTPASPAASTPSAMRRSSTRAEYQQLLLESFRGRSPWGARRPWLRHAAAALQAGAARRRRAAHRAVDGPELRADGAAVGHHARGAGPARAREPPRRRAAYDEGFYRDLVIRFEDLVEDNNLRRDTSLERLASLQAGLRPRRHVDGRQQHADDRRRLGVLLASEAWARRRGLPIQAWLPTARSRPSTSSAAPRAC